MNLAQRRPTETAVETIADKVAGEAGEQAAPDAASVMPNVRAARAQLETLNPDLARGQAQSTRRPHRLQKVLVANRGEIARRFFFILKEEGIPSVAVVTDPDREQSWFQFADQVIYIGAAKNYTNADAILAAVDLSGADAVYPGYGFLSEDYRFVESLEGYARAAGRDVRFMGPSAAIMRRVSNKLDARQLAREHGVPLFAGSDMLSEDDAESARIAERIGYPVIVKLDAGGGGKGMIAVHAPEELPAALASARRIGHAAYGNADCYLEKLIEAPVHIEVQIFNGHAIGIRKCAVQRRNQKIVEESGDAFVDHNLSLRLLAAAETMASVSGYREGGGAGTVEFLLDATTREFGFLEMNTRLQVEYPVTDQSLRIDLARWQVLNFDDRADELPREFERAFRLRFADKEHAIECRIYAEDPWNDFAPAPGRIAELDLPAFNGVRCDFGFRKGDRVLSEYDPMIGKLIVRGHDRREAVARLERALSELYIRGLTTNVDQLLTIVRHPVFRSGDYTNRLLLDHPELCRMNPEADEAQAAVFGAVAEFLAALQRETQQAFRAQDLEEVLARSIQDRLPRGFQIKTPHRTLRVDLLQIDVRRFCAYVEGRPCCELEVHPRLEALDDVLIVRDGRAFPVRIDRRPAHTTLRIQERDGRIYYYRLEIAPVGLDDEADAPGLVRCPFAATFVELARDANGRRLEVGMQVRRGESLITISAMKMECTLVAPTDGEVSFIAEDGDLERLIRGRTADGPTLGKSFAEGEPLVAVRGAHAGEAAAQSVPALDLPAPERFAAPRDLYAKDGTGALADGSRAGLALLAALCRGFVYDPRVLERLQATLQAAASVASNSDFQNSAAEILQDYCTLKQLFSPARGKDQTYFGELNRLIQRWDDLSHQPPLFYRCLAARILRRFGIPDGNDERSPEKKAAFFQVIRAYGMIRECRTMVGALLESLQGRELQPRLRSALLQLQKQESAARDETLGKLSRELLRETRPPQRKTDAVSRAANALPVFAATVPEPDEWPEFARQSIAELRGAHVPLGVRLPLETGEHVAVFAPPPGAEEPTGLCVAWMPEGCPVPERSPSGVITGIPNLERAAAEAARALREASAFAPSMPEGWSWKVYLIGNGCTADIDLLASDPRILQYNNLMRVLRRLFVQYLPLPLHSVIADLRVGREGTPGERRAFRISTWNGRPRLEEVPPEDPAHPAHSAGERASKSDDARTLRMLANEKWPPEVWARHCFDADSAFEEICFPSLDAPASVGSSGPAPKPAAARLYLGRLHGTPALFYIKDSRINGGATGDREGRKYVAAVHYAYLRDIPLYVWNDGAGANIKEGLVSLNRAAQGFLFNALTGARPDRASYRASCGAIEDASLRALLEETEGLIPQAKKADRIANFFLTAVGVGSSTGLDVYGSSQAPLQVMLDNPGSFRALTGANVIRSVTGEELTNYEIGGAPVMGRTGTVDVIARDKTDLIRKIRGLHRMLDRSSTAPACFAKFASPAKLASLAPAEYITDQFLESIADHGECIPLKSEYAEAGALGACLLRLQGRPVLVMGPGETGMRSTPAIWKARDLLRSAERLGLPVILYFGEYWYRETGAEKPERIRARMDFLRTLNGLKTRRLHVILAEGGLARAALNSGADAIVYVSPAPSQSSATDAAAGLADFTVPNAAEAFALCRRILDADSDARAENDSQELAAPGAQAALDSKAANATQGLERPPIPAAANQPFDMKRALRALLDPDSLMVWQDGPGEREHNLITATARLGGRAVAVIADQPLQGGVPDAHGTERFRLFTERMARFRIPLVMVSDAPGFLPGAGQERLRIQQIGAESLDVNVLSEAAVLSVVLRKNFGGRQIHAFSKFLRPGIAAIALSDATMAVMGAEAAFDLFEGKNYGKLLADGKIDAARQLREDYLRDYKRRFAAQADAFQSGALDRTVDDPANLRAAMIEALELALRKNAERQAVSNPVGAENYAQSML